MTDARLYQGGAYSVTASITPEVRLSMGAAYMIGIYPSAEVRVSQAGVNILKQAETSSSLYLVKNHQAGVNVLARGIVDKPILHAWRFPQDDHEFYVLQMGSNGTYVFDKLTHQWAEWQSPDSVNWRGNDGCDWQGINVCCDTQSGKLWKIDADNRLDYETTPITSTVTGGMSLRFRKNVPCFMAELAISEGQTPEGIDPATLGISLRTGDTLTWYDHGTVTGDQVGDKVTVRFYGLGVMGYPGRIFEITDTGIARRIDGLNIEVGGNAGGSQ
jgi:hypothetical protein